MILVDTSVWIDHLRAADPLLVALLADDEVGCHWYVIEELALGSIRQRAKVLELLGRLHRFPTLGHVEVIALISGRQLWGRGLSGVHAHLLGSVALIGGARLWTRDKRLIFACREAGFSFVDES